MFSFISIALATPLDELVVARRLEIDVGYAGLTLYGPAQADQLMHPGIRLSGSYILHCKGVFSSGAPVPDWVKDRCNTWGEARIGGGWWSLLIPDSVILSPPNVARNSKNTGTWGAVWSPYGYGWTNSNQSVIGLDVQGELGLIALYIGSERFESTMLIRPTVLAKGTIRLRITRTLQLRFHYSQHITVPQQLGKSPLSVGSTRNGVWTFSDYSARIILRPKAGTHTFRW